MNIEYTNTTEDFVAFAEHCRRTSPVARRNALVQSLIAAATAFGLVAFMIRNVVFGIGAAVTAVVIYRVITPGWVGRQVRAVYAEGRNKGTVGRHKLELAPDALVEHSEAGTGTYRWDALEKIDVTDGYVFVFTSALAAHVIPARAFRTPEERNDFLDEARRRMAKA